MKFTTSKSLLVLIIIKMTFDFEYIQFQFFTDDYFSSTRNLNKFCSIKSLMSWPISIIRKKQSSNDSSSLNVLCMPYSLFYCNYINTDCDSVNDSLNSTIAISIRNNEINHGYIIEGNLL